MWNKYLNYFLYIRVLSDHNSDYSSAIKIRFLFPTLKYCRYILSLFKSWKWMRYVLNFRRIVCGVFNYSSHTIMMVDERKRILNLLNILILIIYSSSGWIMERKINVSEKVILSMDNICGYVSYCKKIII